MNEYEFREFLKGKQLSETSIDHYCSYVWSIVRSYDLESWDEIVETKKKTLEYIKNLINSPMSLPVPSAKCYRRALCLLYEYKFKQEFDKGEFPKWTSEDNAALRREYEKNHPAPENPQWYQEIIVENPHNWLGFITAINGNGVSGVRSWAFRGQGDAEWELETSLGRSAHYEKGENHTKGDWLRLFEKETMWEFKRESAKRPEYRGFDGMNLLSLVQHYGGKTRLLDFSLAPLLALYMAVEQNEADFTKVHGYGGLDERTKKKLKRRDIAVWAIDLSRITTPLGCSESCKERTVKDIFFEAERFLENMDDGDEKGVYAIFPQTCNERISAQDGLFLMPKSLDFSFEKNLREEVLRTNGPERTFQRLYLSECDPTFMENKNEVPVIIKFVFPVIMGKVLKLESVKRLLAEANVTAKHVYPDLTGLGRYVSNIIEEHCQKMDSKEEIK